jgi:hypothetical protein
MLVVEKVWACAEEKWEKEIEELDAGKGCNISS